MHGVQRCTAFRRRQPSQRRGIKPSGQKQPHGHIRDEVMPHTVDDGLPEEFSRVRDARTSGVLCLAKFLPNLKKACNRSTAPA